MEFKAKRIDNGEYVKGFFTNKERGNLIVPVIDVYKEWDTGDYIKSYEIDGDTLIPIYDSEIYIIERRSGNGKTEDSDCFISSSMNNIVKWIKENKDFDSNDFNWWWVVLKNKIDVEYSTEIYKVFDWDGNELDKQPLSYI